MAVDTRSYGNSPVTVVPVEVQPYGSVHLQDQNPAFVHVVTAADSKSVRGGVHVLSEDLSVALNCV